MFIFSYEKEKEEVKFVLGYARVLCAIVKIHSDETI